jgi:hypothetical protein
MSEEQLVTVCGLYCGACALYRALHESDPVRKTEMLNAMAGRFGSPAEALECEGCLGGGKLAPYCLNCQILHCANNREGVTRCADCPDFPCDLVTSFKNDGIRHHAEVFDSIRDQQKIGVPAWLKKQEERWRCPQCGTPSSWYARVCDKCGTQQPYRLPSLPRDKK